MLIGNIKDIATYFIANNDIYILSGQLLSPNIIEEIDFIYQKA